MKKVILLLLIPFVFQQCTDELYEIDEVITAQGEEKNSNLIVQKNAGSIPLNSYKATYYASENQNSTVTERIESNIGQVYDRLSNANPFTENASTYWVGDFEFEAGDYEFLIQSDKNVTVFIDNQNVFSDVNTSARRTSHKIFKSLDGVHRILIFYNMDKSKIAQKIIEYYTGLHSTEDSSGDQGSSRGVKVSSFADKIVEIEDRIPHVFVNWRITRKI